MIVWLSGVTVKLCDTGVAAAYVAFPDCVAWIVHVPVVISVAVVPDTVHTEPVSDAKLTARFELAEALSAT